MRIIENKFRLSATDLSNHVACAHLTNLEVKAKRGKIKEPDIKSPHAQVLAERGLEHERQYVAHLKSQGLKITDLSPIENPNELIEQTIQAMKKGADVIVQAGLGQQDWFGKADILIKTKTPSELGQHSYEAQDTKLSKETKSGAILQLCLYSECLTQIQGTQPEYLHIIKPATHFKPESHRVSDYMAYYRYTKSRLLKSIKEFDAQAANAMPAQTVNATSAQITIDTYPEPTTHCDVCKWWEYCDRKRREDDHLSLTAGASKLQIRELETTNIDTVEKLAQTPLPFTQKFQRGSPESFIRIREQARVQVEGRTQKKPIHEMLQLEPGRGLYLLPEPSPGDIFFDIEGDPYVGDSGLEYLFGFSTNESPNSKYNSRWAFNSSDEKTMFEWFMDFVIKQWQKYPDFHIYHYNHYEPSALKRLMGRYGTREDEVDRLLRSGKFIDLHTVVKQSLRASVEQYSIKELEKFYGFTRQIKLQEASKHKHTLEHAIELNKLETLLDESKNIVEKYNEDDCVSALKLRDWLESLRFELESKGTKIPRPITLDGEPTEELSEKEQAVQKLKERLTKDVPVEPQERTPEQQALWLLSELLSFHRRESKPVWWDFFRLKDLSAEELIDEKSGLSGLKFKKVCEGGTKQCPIEEYTFPPQELDIKEGATLHLNSEKPWGTNVSVDLSTRTIQVKKRKGMGGVHPQAVFAHDEISADILHQALMRLGEHVATHGLKKSGPYQASLELLLKAKPKYKNNELDFSILPIQGPPGAGKTHTGGEMILDLLASGKKVGVTGGSHKVIRNLLSKVAENIKSKNIFAKIIQKVSEESENQDPTILEVLKSTDALAALNNDEGVLIGGTPWLWAHEDAFGKLDVLFVDEAGQMSLPNVLAVSQSSKNLVMLGDPQQLDQPLKGTHPEGTAVSALDHLLDGHKTIPQDKGMFLSETWRLHPEICAFTSELFYEGRLKSRPGLEKQILKGNPFEGKALWYQPVGHSGNQNSSLEEVAAIKKIVESLIKKGSQWISNKGEASELTLNDILIVAPYNAQVFRIMDAIPGARAGTVDKFQGQEAPVVIYSMTTSSHEDAPRGMEFLYSLNRFNVATSRARCCCILVANPRLFEPECRNPRQMRLSNAFCRYLEIGSGFAEIMGTTV